VKKLSRSILSCCAASEIGVISVVSSGDVIYDPQKVGACNGWLCKTSAEVRFLILRRMQVETQACGGLMECFGDKRGKVRGRLLSSMSSSSCCQGTWRFLVLTGSSCL
jgi:hypothetical protein